ncbi:MAG: alkaline phosphatase D family protein [Phycisphaeraceae bacterium]
MNRFNIRSFWCLCVVVLIACADSTHAEPAFGQGIMVGEVTETTAVVQVRVTDGTELVDGETYDDGDALRDGDQPGLAANVTFIVAESKLFDGTVRSGRRFVAMASPDQDHLARIVLEQLEPGTQYTVMALLPTGARGGVHDKIAATFTTLAGAAQQAPTRFHVVTGMNYDKFYGNENPARAYRGEDRALGYPALDSMRKLKPDFIVYTGDDVYYDKPPKVKTLTDMRAKWHRQFAQPRFIELSRAVPGYWMKDDHDHRTNDSDATGDYFPSHELGIKTFREQLPIFAQDDDTSPTYRTHRVSKDVQIWLLEGRDYRSPNKMEDGPGKTIWGAEQRAWLKKTLTESDATYRLIISPTPMVGPDDAYKRDNHTNPKGFKHEGDAFKKWAAEQGLWDNGAYFLCGDRHWQYHSIDPSGAHEFSSGAICDANSRIGRQPGTKGSTDPEGLIKQPYFQRPASGGFLSVVCEPGEDGAKAVIRFEFYDEHGELLYKFQPGEG